MSKSKSKKKPANRPSSYRPSTSAARTTASSAQTDQKWYQSTLARYLGGVIATILVGVVVIIIAAIIMGWSPHWIFGQSSPGPSQESLANKARSQALGVINDAPGRILSESKFGTFMGPDSNGYVDSYTAASQVRNFYLNVEFDSTNSTDWRFGILFRGATAPAPKDPSNDLRTTLSMEIASDGTWTFEAMENITNYPNSARTNFQNGTSEHITKGRKARNALELIVKDDTAYVYINEYYLATLDLSRARASISTLDLAGDVVPFTALPAKVSKDDAPKYTILRLGSLDPNCADTDEPSITGAWGDCKSGRGQPSVGHVADRIINHRGTV